MQKAEPVQKLCKELGLANSLDIEQTGVEPANIKLGQTDNVHLLGVNVSEKGISAVVWDWIIEWVIRAVEFAELFAVDFAKNVSAVNFPVPVQSVQLQQSQQVLIN